MVLSNGGVLNDNVDVVVLSLAINFVADDDGGDGVTLGSCPRDDRRCVSGVRKLDVVWCRRDS